MKSGMIENVQATTEVAHTVVPLTALASKKYFILAGVILFGAISHAIEDTRKSGWKGMGWFVANTFVAGFVGMLFSHVASLISVDWMYAAGGIGGYMGPAAFKYIRSAAFARLGLNEQAEKPNQK